MCLEEDIERESLRQAKVARRIQANTIVGFMRFRQRGGSQPEKLTWLLANKPLYWWKMKAASECEHLDRVIVFTDIKEALEDAKVMSPKLIPIKQSPKDCQEPAYDFIDDLKTPHSRRITERTFQELASSAGLEDPVEVHLDVTSPLESSESLTRLIECFFEDDFAEGARIVCRTDDVYWTPDPRHPKYGLPVWHFLNVRARQMRPPLYKLSGSRIMMYEWHTRARTLLVPIPEEETLQVHNRGDLERAEYYLKRRLEQQNE